MNPQVFSVYMHLTYAAEHKAAVEGRPGAAHKAAGKLTEFCSAVEQVTEAELLELGLPVLRLAF